MPAADKLANYAEQHAPMERIRRMRDFRRWVQANKTLIEKTILFGAHLPNPRPDWITPPVVDAAWRMLRARRREST